MGIGVEGETRNRPLALAAIGLVGILAGAVLGGATSVVNSLISKDFFINVYGWENVTEVWRSALASGILAGLIFGIIFSLIFTTVVGFVSKAACPFGFAFLHILVIYLVVIAFWVLGGLIAIGLATLSPEFIRNTYRVPEGFGPMLAFVWVGGSGNGAIWGGLASVIIGSLIFRANWRRRLGT